MNCLQGLNVTDDLHFRLTFVLSDTVQFPVKDSRRHRRGAFKSSKVILHFPEGLNGTNFKGTERERQTRHNAIDLKGRKWKELKKEIQVNKCVRYLEFDVVKNKYNAG